MLIQIFSTAGLAAQNRRTRGGELPTLTIALVMVQWTAM